MVVAAKLVITKRPICLSSESQIVSREEKYIFSYGEKIIGFQSAVAGSGSRKDARAGLGDQMAGLKNRSHELGKISTFM